MNGDVSLPGHTTSPCGATPVVDGYVSIIIEESSGTLVCATSRVAIEPPPATLPNVAARRRPMWDPYAYAALLAVAML